MIAISKSLSVLLIVVGSGPRVTAPRPGVPLIGDPQLQAAGMHRFWEARLPLAPRDSIESGYLVDESLYVITAGGSVFAIEADVGLIRWADQITEADYLIFRPSHLRRSDGHGPVVIPTTTKTLIYDRFSGELLHRFSPPFAAGGPVVGYDNLLFSGSLDGRFYSLQLVGTRSQEPVKRWDVMAGGPVTAAPVLYDREMLLFASQGGTVFACRGGDKTLGWSFSTDGPILGDPVVDESGVYVASTDRSLYKLHRGIGRVIWRRRMQQSLVDGPVVVAHTVYQHCPGHGLSAIDADTGRERWHTPNGRTFVAHTRSGEIIATNDRRLLLVDQDTGAIKSTLDAPDAVATVVNTRDDAMYVLAADGRILCARSDGVPYLRRQQILAARARLNLPPLDESKRMQVKDRRAQDADDPFADDPLRSRRDVRP